MEPSIIINSYYTNGIEYYLCSTFKKDELPKWYKFDVKSQLSSANRLKQLSHCNLTFVKLKYLFKEGRKLGTS